MNPRIKEILDDLAILSQALHSEQENVESLSILGKIKLLSAQLYLESDMELITSNQIEDDQVNEPVEEEKTEELPFFSFDLDQAQPEELITQENEDSEDSSDQKVSIIPNVDKDDSEVENNQIQTEEPEIIIEPISKELEQKLEKDLHFSQNFEGATIEFTQTTIEINHPSNPIQLVEEELTLEEAQEIANEVIEEEVKPFSTADNLAAANAVISKFSLTRRYEFMNFLFGGDMNRFAVFISEIINAPNESSREDIYSKWHDENQWSRKYETASDLKRNLNKILLG